MKLRNYSWCMLVVGVAMLMLAGCSSPKGLVFANRDWHVSSYYGQLIDKDTTYRFSFGNVLIPDPMPIISSTDSVEKYPGLDKFLADVLHTCKLDSAKILFYSPDMHTMVVEPKGKVAPERPASISVRITDDKPYTTWVYDDDVEDWNRKPLEMYTYTYFDKRKKRLLVVDHYDYGDTPVAQIYIFQSITKATDKVKGLPEHCWLFFIHDVSKIAKDIEFWSSTVNGHRAKSIDNFKIGRNPKLKLK